MLKEAALNSNKDKLNLKKSLEDISHQLKTPLTSILVLLDNLIDEPDMDSSIRNDFIIDIKRNVININFLVQALLKLSKFDANTVHFIKKENDLEMIVKEAIKNVSTLCDLRNINIKLNTLENAKVECDVKWQIEAITNIIKNAIEHTDINGKIKIMLEETPMSISITISDNGEGIEKSDIKNIFKMC